MDWIVNLDGSYTLHGMLRKFKLNFIISAKKKPFGGTLIENQFWLKLREWFLKTKLNGTVHLAKTYKSTRKLTVTCICVPDFVVYSIRKKMAINFGGFIFTNLHAIADVKSAYDH